MQKIPLKDTTCFLRNRAAQILKNYENFKIDDDSSSLVHMKYKTKLSDKEKLSTSLELKAYYENAPKIYFRLNEEIRFNDQKVFKSFENMLKSRAKPGKYNLIMFFESFFITDIEVSSLDSICNCLKKAENENGFEAAMETSLMPTLVLSENYKPSTAAVVAINSRTINKYKEISNGSEHYLQQELDQI